MINYVQDRTRRFWILALVTPQVSEALAGGRGISEELQRGGVGAVADLDYSQAQQVLDAAMKKAAEIDTLMNVAVVDAGGNLKAFGRMEAPGLAASTFRSRRRGPHGSST